VSYSGLGDKTVFRRSNSDFAMGGTVHPLREMGVGEHGRARVCVEFYLFCDKI